MIEFNLKDFAIWTGIGILLILVLFMVVSV